MKRYRIFISSTIDDLQDARASVDLKLRTTDIFEAIRVENFPAIGEPSRRVCLNEVADADALVLILNNRYGFIPEANNPENLSVTHLEYREAKRLNKPIFAFLRDCVEPEPKLRYFMEEIGDFTEGVLRKKWQDTEDLRKEVLRALLFWLARRARENPSSEARQQFTAELARHRDFEKFPLFFVTFERPGFDMQSWLNTVFEQLSSQCEQRLLPSPRLLDKIESKLHRLMLRVSLDAKSGRFLVAISVAGDKDSESPKITLLPPIEVNVAQTTEGADFIARISIALILIMVDDWSRSIDQLFTCARNRNATDHSRARLLGTAAYISAFNGGQRCFDVVRRLLDIPRLDAPTISAGIMALLSAELRYEHARAQHALLETEQLALRLLTLALNRNEASSETLYNLAR
ncbi:MAG TPA: DUF4062 domain-containing protein, partial [Candidatus Binatia bacterium]|nr:DUF4062 domain-containing protein [Candidatus Binatia bacterium]